MHISNYIVDLGLQKTLAVTPWFIFDSFNDTNTNLGIQLGVKKSV